MDVSIGKKLISERLITDSQLAEALGRQKIHGGKLGANLEALGYITEETLASVIRKPPTVPRTVEDTGLELSFIADLVMKHVLFMGEFNLAAVVERVKLPLSVVDAAVDMLRRGKFVEVLSAEGYSTLTYRFRVSEQGRNRAQELLEICRYAGPAPVTLEKYHEMVLCQSVNSIEVNADKMRSAYSHLVIGDDFFRRLGPALNSGKSLFMYGPSGNGKTVIAENIKSLLPDAIYVPYAVIVMGQIINVYDPVNHTPVAESAPSADVDQRWLRTKRPVIIVGGELTPRMLDLDFSPISKFYEAPLQMKANNGLFIVDDFGRQQIAPHEFLNRWIVPLEKRVDYINLHTGIKILIPFDLFVVFSTNLEPRDLVDEAFLRRIRYKVKVDRPSREGFGEIFRRVCECNGVAFDRPAYDFLLERYARAGRDLAACHPRDLLDHIIDDARFRNVPPLMTEETIAAAWDSYFVDSEGE